MQSPVEEVLQAVERDPGIELPRALDALRERDRSADGRPGERPDVGRFAELCPRFRAVGSRDAAPDARVGAGRIESHAVAVDLRIEERRLARLPPPGVLAHEYRRYLLLPDAREELLKDLMMEVLGVV